MGTGAFDMSEIRVGACLQSKQDEDLQPLIVKELPDEQFECVVDDGTTRVTLNLQQIVMDYNIMGHLDQEDLKEYL